MATKQNITDAYKSIRDYEKGIVDKIVELHVEFNTRLQAIKDMIPEGGSASTVGQYIGRIEGNFSGVFGYDLSNLKSQYGIVDENNTPPAPPAA